MTDTQKAAQQALEALEQLQGGCTDHNDGTVEAITVWCPEVIDALRAALAEQPAEQEPVAWWHRKSNTFTSGNLVSNFAEWAPLYTAPQPAKPAEQEPVAAQHRFRHPQKGTPDWSVWQPCKVTQRPAWEVDSQGYEVEYRALYTAPQPRRRLTDGELDNTTRKQVDDLLDHIYEYGTAAEGIIERVRAIARAIEAAVWGEKT